MKWSYQLTDTYGSEANYNWIKEGFVFANSPLSAVRKVKKELELTGVECKREDCGDMIVLRPYNENIILFIEQDYR